MRGWIVPLLFVVFVVALFGFLFAGYSATLQEYSCPPGSRLVHTGGNFGCIMEPTRRAS